MAGILEVTSDVRSVPLGAKRKRGRPKKMPNCLVKSPISVRSAPVLGEDNPPPLVDDDDVDVDDDDIPEEVVPAVRKTTRKRKRCEAEDQPLEPDVQQSPVLSLLSQTQPLKPGLGCSKPPKKIRSGPKPTSSTLPEPEPSQTKRPQVLKCKKKKGSCNHEVVFDQHYDKKSWKMYADHVRGQTSSVQIDPNYAC